MNTQNTEDTAPDRPITLAKALAIKNRLAGRLASTRAVVQLENSKLVGQRDGSVDVRAELARYEAIQRAIVAVKDAIQRANTPIHARIFELAEVKDRIKLFSDLDTKHGAEPGYNGAEWVYDAVVRKAEALAAVRRLETLADQIQDELNAFNAATLVDLPPGVLDLAG